MTLKILTREEIAEKSEIRIEIEPIPEWGDDVAVGMRYWSGTERDEFDMELQRRKPGDDDLMDLIGMKAFCLALSICDESGERLYDEAGIDELNDLNSEILQRLFKKAQEMNGIGDKAVEELEKNSNGVQSADSGSDSPASSEDEQ